VELQRKRSKIDVATREAILKLKTDGLPLDCLRLDGLPWGVFWRRAQDKYAKLFGTRPLRRLKEYANKKAPGSKTIRIAKQRDGKDTCTDFSRRRLRAAKRLHTPLTAVPEALAPVFAAAPIPLAEVRAAQLRLQEEQAEQQSYQRIYDKLHKKTAAKKAVATGLCDRTPGARRWSQPTGAQRGRARTLRLRNRLKLAGCVFRGTAASRLDFQASVRRYGGRPLVFVHSAEHLPGRGLDEEYGGQPLRMDCFMRSLPDYALQPSRLQQRLFVVPLLDDIPVPIRLAAILMGARVQQQVDIPAIRYERLWSTLCAGDPTACLHFGCTQEFAQARKDIVQLLKGVHANTCWGAAFVPRAAFFLTAPGKTAPAKERKRWTLLCQTPTDPGIPDSCAHVARTVHELFGLARALLA